MNYLAAWQQNVVSRPSLRLREAVELETLREANLGPRWEWAKIKVRAEPSEQLEIFIKLAVEQPHFLEYGYIDAAIFGLLDTLLLAAQSPLTKVRLTLIELHDHEVDSSQNAFRMAGRELGRRLIESAIGQKLGQK